MRHSVIRALFWLFIGVAVQSVWVTRTGAFYEYARDEWSVELNGLMRGFWMAWKNPESAYFYSEKSDDDAAGLIRFMGEAQVGQSLRFTANIYQTHIPASLVSGRAGIGPSLDIERSSALERSFSKETYSHLAVDRLYAHWSWNRLDLMMGRQPINLATTFYFTPNDFFAPFAAQTFYRVYKPGVDAVRADIRLADLSQFSLISVLGYAIDLESDTGWSEKPDNNRISYIGRLSAVFCDFNWALIGGAVREIDIIGGSLQGELFRWLGVRAEGHRADPQDSQQDSYSELSVGIEHRWESSLNMRLEQFYYGQGAGSVSYYGMSSMALQDRPAYLGRNYTALGIGYEFTPLLNGDMVTIANLTDNSYLVSLNTVYSLSDEAELTVNLEMPLGKKPRGPEIRSEFGLYPYSINIEARWYF
jgi:hypothetical protein